MAGKTQNLAVVPMAQAQLIVVILFKKTIYGLSSATTFSHAISEKPKRT